MPDFNGVSIQCLGSPKYQLYDGLQMGFKSGIYTVVWMPKVVKERIAEFLPEDLIDKIATEEEEEWEEEGTMVPMGTVGLTIQGAGGASGFKVILKNCKIHAESIIIKKIESKRKK